MPFIREQIQAFCFLPRGLLPLSGPLSFPLFLWKFDNFKIGFRGVSELSHEVSKLGCEAFKMLEGTFSVESQFGKSMPLCSPVQECQDNCIVWLQ